MINFGQKRQVHGRQFMMGITLSWAVLWVIDGAYETGRGYKWILRVNGKAKR